MRALLQAHGRLPPGNNSQDIGRAAVMLLTDMIERLKGAPGAPERERLPHKVLTTCFLQGTKHPRAAMELDLSERQLSRERARAIALLTERLVQESSAPTYFPEAVPPLARMLPRPDLARTIASALEHDEVVHVYGPAGIGKTAVAVELSSNGGRPVWWYRFRKGINDSLQALLVELSRWLASHGLAELRTYATANVAMLDATVASRIAIQSLGEASALIVVDDYHCVDDDPEVTGFFEEVAARAATKVVALSRRRPERDSRTAVEIPPLALSEVEAFLNLCGVRVPLDVVARVHHRTGGNPRLVELIVPRLRSANGEKLDRLLETFDEDTDVQSVLLSNVVDLLDDDRRVLEAASIFRSRFSDDALAYVAELTHGIVRDVLKRLVRSYVVTRSAGDAVGFVHPVAQAYVYDRLGPQERERVHLRAAAWCHLLGDEPETRYHRERAGLENP